MDNQKSKNILICPLGWGLGHISRDIPIIDALIAKGHKVIVAADMPQLFLIKKRFPEIATLNFPSLTLRFSRSRFQLLPLLWFAVKLPFYISWEHFRLKKIIAKYNVDLVISDNRYGLWSRQVKSIIVTHQLRVIPPFPFRWALQFTESLVKQWVQKFNEVWVPDFDDERSVAGILSKTSGMENLQYIGLLSRFSNLNNDGVFSSFEMVVTASGPEPQRSIFVDIAVKLANKWSLNCLIIEGKPENGLVPRNVNGVWLVGHLPDLQFALAVKNSKYLILRGGYSTIMDMLTLGVVGLFVPTPGQTEQEYLAEYLDGKNGIRALKQAELLSIDIEMMEKRRIEPLKSDELFKNAIALL